MITKTTALVAAGVAAAVLGAGGIAAAATAHSTTAGSGTPSSSSSSTRSHHGDLHLRRIEHGQFVTKGKDGKQVTHEVVNGTITAVSANSITVKDGSGTSTTFAVTSSTRVHVDGQAKGAKSSITALKDGETVFVLGTGTGPFTADRVAEHKA